MKETDERLMHTVIDELSADDDLRGYDIEVESKNGVIQLTGIVDVLADKWKAEQIAASVKGVRKVENGLTISTDGSIDDEAVQFEVTEELNADPRVNLRKVGAQVKDGVVYLVGSVDSVNEKIAAIEAAGKARGVKDIVSRVEVGKREEIDDVTITNQVKQLLAHDPRLNPGNVQVKTKRGVVTLLGAVQSKNDAEYAAELAGSIRGVRRVRNSLQY